jgi:putative N-acetylmannosamine-6-phosphate epimerase/predicted NBD/HSP70 family sugar kinase
MNLSASLQALHRRLIVSCQAWEDDPFHQPGLMALFARAAVDGGAAGIRANGPADVREIKAATGVPVIGIQKRMSADGRVLITPEFEDGAALAAAGADAVALDCTARGQSFGALQRLARIRGELGVPVAADIATIEEALAAQQAGADFVLSTMRGYTAETAHVKSFDSAFVAELVRRLRVPVIAEGRIWSPVEAQAALDAGAFAVVVGSAITRPRDITARFAGSLGPWSEPQSCFLGIDIGGTNVKSGLVLPGGEVINAATEPTRLESRATLLGQVGEIAAGLADEARARALQPLAAGIATAGWPDPATGIIVYGTGNLPQWTGAPILEAVARRVEMPVFVENDANALAVGEKSFGAARHADTFICVTLGTGVGAGCYAGGRLLRGGHFQGNQLGHLVIDPDGLPCTCGQRGCLEPYANAAALLRYAGLGTGSSHDVIAAARAGDASASAAVAKLGGYLAKALTPAVQLLDPELIVLAGGAAQDNFQLAEEVAAAIGRGVPRWAERRVEVRLSALGYHGGVAGAGAVARAGIAA